MFLQDEKCLAYLWGETTVHLKDTLFSILTLFVLYREQSVFLLSTQFACWSVRPNATSRREIASITMEDLWASVIDSL